MSREPARVGIKVSPCGGYNDVGMPLPDTIQTYTFYFTELASMKLAYIQFVRDFPPMDITVPSHYNVMQSSDTVTRAYKRGTPHDVLAVYGGLFKPLPSALQDHSEDALRGAAMPRAPFAARNPTPTRVLVNGGVLPAEAKKLIARRVVDAVVFGTLWIINPDLQVRIEQKLPLNTQLDLAALYEGVEGDIRAGYTTYALAGESRLSV
ncbi:hypothetical protein PHLGIDRAFT_182975 [Phlebiopsis gigantea 11061_1 CR5-6]|uniref:Uncharacterized protein n=1 Tax=Phlebiopsis gigantea (strain 11061_1 CR5-6) TaxID=745531 RepID=A0A0C3RUH2_PHLG1|nr:hypothetical protein PHLGIDRAFT_182975 [Phlebiopsis gigantea 11061_1 CR5-6]